MKAIIGLGNPGPRYRHTRHNVAWMVLDELAARWRLAKAKPEHTRHAEVLRTTVDGATVLLVKPLTFMNDSGKVARALVEKDHLAPEEMLVICDDIDLALGRIRVRTQGSSGGHNGLKSIQQHLAQLMRSRVAGREGRVANSEARGSDGGASDDLNPKSQIQNQKSGQPPAFPRIKVGLGRPPAGVDPIDYVLTTFTPDELTLIRPAIERAADAAESWLRDGIDVTMNRFNGLTGAATN